MEGKNEFFLFSFHVTRCSHSFIRTRRSRSNSRYWLRPSCDEICGMSRRALVCSVEMGALREKWIHFMCIRFWFSAFKCTYLKPILHIFFSLFTLPGNSFSLSQWVDGRCYGFDWIYNETKSKTEEKRAACSHWLTIWCATVRHLKDERENDLAH